MTVAPLSQNRSRTGGSLRQPSAVRVPVLLVVSAVFVFFIVAFLVTATRGQSKVDPGVMTAPSIDNIVFNFRQIMGYGSGLFAAWLGNSAVTSLGGAIVAVVTAVPSGYALAHLRFPGRRALLFLTLLTMVIPNTVLVIPLFLEVAAVHAVNQAWPVILIMGFYPFGVYLSYIHYRTALPVELVEAARIDGVHEIGIFFRVALPLAGQAVALVFFFSFVANWTNYFLPLVLLPVSANSTVPVGLAQMISQSQMFDPTAAAGLNVQLYMPQLALAALLQMLPVLILFVGAQRFLMRGTMMGAVKL
jgi:multiple sugar transport system permease protein